jgi:hypothetical protein
MEFKENQGIIHNQRGIGFFLSERALEVTTELKRKSFVNRDLPQVFKAMDLLRLGLEDSKGEIVMKKSSIVVAGALASSTIPREMRRRRRRISGAA